MNVTTISPPPFEPVTLAEVYAHLRLDPDDGAHPDDSLLTGFIEAARTQVEQMTRRSLVARRLRVSYGNWPACGLRLWRPPVLRVIAVRRMEDGELVEAEGWTVSDEQIPRLRFVDGRAPAVLHGQADALQVEYEAGYAPAGSPPTTQADYAANIPRPLRDAILLGVQLLYDTLAPDQRDRIERTREALISPYRVLVV